MFSSISTCRLPVQAKLPSLQFKVNSNYFLPVKYISNLVVIVDRFLSKACVCGLHLHNGAKRELPEDGVWRVVTSGRPINRVGRALLVFGLSI